MNKPVILTTAAALIASAAVASAQTTPPTTSRTPPTTAATATTAKAQIEASGYTDVKNLRRKDDGSWQARAMKNNTEVAVSVDSRGNVTQMSR